MVQLSKCRSETKPNPILAARKSMQNHQYFSQLHIQKVSGRCWSKKTKTEDEIAPRNRSCWRPVEYNFIVDRVVEGHRLQLTKRKSEGGRRSQRRCGWSAWAEELFTRSWFTTPLGWQLLNTSTSTQEKQRTLINRWKWRKIRDD